MIQFERPALAAAAFIIIPLAIYAARRLGNSLAASIPLGPPGGMPFKAPVNLKNLVIALRVMEYCGIFLLFAGAAGPLIKTSETIWLNRGADILFVLDISPSMAAVDMDGANRFVTARKLIKEFAQRRPSDSMGLVAVGKDAALLVPPTSDHGVFSMRLDELRLGELGDGTALGLGLANAAYHLEKSPARRKAVILVSDGESNAGAVHPETAAAMIGDMGISLWVIGIGSGGEVPIDYVDPFTRMRRTGLFDSSYDIESLQKISAAGNGTWISAPSASALASAFTFIDDQEMVIRRSGTVRHSRPCHIPFMLAALCLIAFSGFVRRFFLGAWA
jgi:Ca-activated chloride channel family protein